MRKLLVGLYFLLTFSLFASENVPAYTFLTDEVQDVFIFKKRIAVFQDSLENLTFNQIYKSKENLFTLSKQRNLINEDKESTYWLYFVVVNHSKNSNFRLELYDFDIDEITFFSPQTDGTVKVEHAGFSLPFYTRTTYHKNPGFDLQLDPQEKSEVFLKIKSKQTNILKPVIRHYQSFITYGLKEYLILGVFYGLVLLILIYNLIYFLILRALHYLYYVLYGGCLLIYLLTQNGMGFQFLWPSYPQLNPYIDCISLSFSVVFLLLFCNSYLRLKVFHPQSYRLVGFAIVLKIVLLFTQLIYNADLVYNIIDFLFFQLCFAFGIMAYKGRYEKIKWFLMAFIVFNSSVFISMGESYGVISSNILSVYSLNIGLLLQFVFFSIGIAESIRDSDREKQKVLIELLQMREKNEALRLTELKRQMNPHFIFNALNSIQSKILTDKKNEASKFLILFSKLIRKNLEISDVEFITLDEELSNIEVYLEIENMRLGDSFSYQFIVDENVATDTIKIPTFLIQPLVENAIWHGLMPLETEKKLSIEIKKEGGFLKIRIIDNGIGIQKSQAMKRDKSYHTSKGLGLIVERLELISKKLNKRNSLQFLDNDLDKNCGTQALLTLEI